ncbi:MAG TPA: hypothetical protein VGO93_15345 [Candidatus Xenobia bacterium]
MWLTVAWLLATRAAVAEPTVVLDWTSTVAPDPGTVLMRNGDSRYVGGVLARAFPRLSVRIVENPGLVVLCGLEAEDASGIAADWDQRMTRHSAWIRAHPHVRFGAITQIVIALQNRQAESLAPRLETVFPGTTATVVAGQNMLLVTGYHEDVLFAKLLVDYWEAHASAPTAGPFYT